MIDDESEVLWEAPPATAKTGRRVNRRGVLERVVANAGSWARLGEWNVAATARQTASDVRSGRALPEHPPGEFEATWAEVEGSPGTWGVWVRFVPSDPPSTNGKKPH